MSSEHADDLSDAGYEWCAEHERYEEPDSDHADHTWDEDTPEVKAAIAALPEVRRIRQLMLAEELRRRTLRNLGRV